MLLRADDCKLSVNGLFCGGGGRHSRFVTGNGLLPCKHANNYVSCIIITLFKCLKAKSTTAPYTIRCYTKLGVKACLHVQTQGHCSKISIKNNQYFIITMRKET